MSDNRIRPAGPPAPSTALSPETAAAVRAATANASPAPSFAEAQRRLANRRRERAAADAERRAQAIVAAAAQREAAAAALRARFAVADQSTPASLPQRLGGTALVAWDGARRMASTISSRFAHGDASASLDLAHRPAFRVSQVDAELLDEELLDLMRGQVSDALQYIRGGTLQDDWQPEIMLFLRAALFKLSVWDHDATYGAALQNLRYADARGGKKGSAVPRSVRDAVPVPPSKWQKAVYGLVTVGGRYAWTKWEDWLRDNDGGGGEDEYGEVDSPENTSSDGSYSMLAGRLRVSPQIVRRLSRVTTITSDLYAGAAFVSFLVFLRYGRYRTLLDRVLRMRLVPPTSQVSREVSFEYLNRQLVWHAFTEFLLFLLPLVGINRWRRWLTRTWRKTRGAVAKAASTVKETVKGGTGDEEAGEAEGAAMERKGELAFLPERTCAICYQDQNTATSEADIMAAAAASSGVIGSAETDITNPYEAIPCGCVYCYVSLATRIEREEGDGWTCLRCGTLVTACRPWNGDVLEPFSAESSPAAGDGLGAATAAANDGRPSSSSTSASGSPLHQQKSVGFADDVKGEDEDDQESSNDEIAMDDDEAEAEDGDDDEVDDEGDSESEAYEEDEDSVEGDVDGDLDE